MHTIVVQRQVEIERPIDVVRRQFVDMEHHCSGKVHADLSVTDVKASAGKCTFTGRRRVFGVLHEDEIEVTSHADGSSTLRSLSGTNAGLLITQNFEALGPQATRVTVKVDYPVKGLMRLLGPLVRLGLARDTETALREDKLDLEQRYMRAGAA